jgi:hypothetical protein
MSANGHNDECATNSRWADWLGIQVELTGWEDLQVLRPTQAQIKLVTSIAAELSSASPSRLESRDGVASRLI